MKRYVEPGTMWISANKRQMYRLVSGYVELPPMKETEFVRYPSGKTFALKWQGGRAELMPIFGTPMLFIADEFGERKYELTVQELMDRGMAAGGGLDA